MTEQGQPISSRALVLGGGGVTGIAWEIGVLAGLTASGIDLTKANVVIGTSAGAFVGVAVASAYDLEILAAAQSEPQSDEIAVAASQETIAAWFNAFGAGDATRVGAAFGEIAKANPEPVSIQARRSRRRRPAGDDRVASHLESDCSRCRHRGASHFRPHFGSLTSRCGGHERGGSWRLAPRPHRWPILDRRRDGLINQCSACGRLPAGDRPRSDAYRLRLNPWGRGGCGSDARRCQRVPLVTG